MADTEPEDDVATTPVWVRALASALRRPRKSRDSELPLTTTAREIVDWIEIASGPEGWARTQNPESLFEDLRVSAEDLGPELRALLDPDLGSAQASWVALRRTKAQLKLSPEQRQTPEWTRLRDALSGLRSIAISDDAVAANWSDLIRAMKAGTDPRRSHRAIAELLGHQLRLRGTRLPMDDAALVMLSGKTRWMSRSMSDDFDERGEWVRDRLLQPGSTGDIVVWLGYRGTRANFVVEAGHVTMFNAEWLLGRHKAGMETLYQDELESIARYPPMKASANEADADGADVLIRVALGAGSPIEAAERAVENVESLIGFSLHWSRGYRPRLAYAITLVDGQPGPSSWWATDGDNVVDYYGLNATADAFDRDLPRIGVAIADRPLPQLLAAALRAQGAADRPTTRARMLASPTVEERMESFRHEDVVVQYIASYAEEAPQIFFAMVAQQWPHLTWRNELQLAVEACVEEFDGPAELRDQLYGAIRSDEAWISSIGQHYAALLDALTRESDRAWVSRLMKSISSADLYREIIAELETKAARLLRRRLRVRNSLTHGSPASWAVVESIAPFSSFLSQVALEAGIEAHIEQTSVQQFLERSLSDHHALMSGTRAVDLWR